MSIDVKLRFMAPVIQVSQPAGESLAVTPHREQRFGMGEEIVFSAAHPAIVPSCPTAAINSR
jgi:hypothetical protein